MRLRILSHWITTADFLIGVNNSSHIAHREVFSPTNWWTEGSGRCLIFKYASSVQQTSAGINYWEANIGKKSPRGLQIIPVEQVLLPNLRSAILLHGCNWKNWLRSSCKHKSTQSPSLTPVLILMSTGLGDFDQNFGFLRSWKFVRTPVFFQGKL